MYEKNLKIFVIVNIHEFSGLLHQQFCHFFFVTILFFLLEFSLITHMGQQYSAMTLFKGLNTPDTFIIHGLLDPNPSHLTPST